MRQAFLRIHSLWLFLLFWFGLVFMVSPCWADLKDALDAQERGDWDTAIQEFKETAENDHDPLAPYAQTALGLVYELGQGSVSQNLSQAVYWYRQAAENGQPVAQAALGRMLYDGLGVSKDPAEALFWFHESANHGNANGQAWLGAFLLKDGSDQDYQSALKWLRLAAEQGHPEAQFNLGGMYFEGKGVDQDFGEALHFFLQAAKQGQAKAQYYLAEMYEDGLGVPADSELGKSWLNRAAEQGYIKAQAKLAAIYASGHHTPQDFQKAAFWAEKAAEKGSPEAQYLLGLFYTQGWGVPMDNVMAYMWFNLSAASGFERAQEMRDMVSKLLSPKALEEAQRLVREWLARKGHGPEEK